MTIFFISSYCLLDVRSKINMPLKNLPKIENNLAYNLLNGWHKKIVKIC